MMQPLKMAEQMQAEELEQTKVLIVEDHQIVRMGLRMALAHAFNIVGEAEDGIQAIKLASELKPDVILMDIGLPRMDGVKATNIIKQESTSVRVIMLTSQDSDNGILAALAAGADGYCLKEIHNDQLVLAIQTVASGSAWLDPVIASHILGWTHSTSVLRNGGRDPATGDFALSENELAILRLVAEGLSGEKIATRQSTDLTTIRGDFRRIIEKLASSARN